MAQKSRDFRAHPFKQPELWISPHPNPYFHLYIKNRYIGNFMDKRFQGPFRDVVSNKRVRSLRWRLTGVEGWEVGESEGENKRGGGGEWGVGYVYFAPGRRGRVGGGGGGVGYVYLTPPPHSIQLNHINTPRPPPPHSRQLNHIHTPHPPPTADNSTSYIQLSSYYTTVKILCNMVWGRGCGGIRNEFTRYFWGE